jgi:very-short-patch-repair endonuclease
MPDQPDPRIAASLDGWKRKLLDLSKRNRALSFRPTKVSTITIVDELPAEVFRRIYIEEKPMRFQAAPDSTTEAPAEEEPSELSDLLDEETEDRQPATFVPYAPSEIAARHVDDALQTALVPDRLDKALRRLDELARTSLEEQGVATLFLAMGMLHYKEAEQSTEPLKAPVLLMPVQLSRSSARAAYSIRVGDDDPMVNPALVELLRRSFSITAPELPDLATIPDDYDLQTFFDAFEERTRDKTGWRVGSDMYLGQFSFQKFVMYKDLETHSTCLAAHEIVRQIATRSGPGHVGLPDEIRELNLDTEFLPEKSWQVVDADSSQLRAIAAVDRGHDLVIEGPPGTGKSQTITNLIAQALAAGKAVLFVAEKMAALQVVQSRLQAAGLGEFCLELHSTKANKRLVMREIANALDSSLQRPESPDVSPERLAELRTRLTRYVETAHAPYGTLAISPYRAYGELAKVLDAPKHHLTADISAVTAQQLKETVRGLEDLAAAASQIGNAAEHPWRDSTKSFLSEHDLDVADGTGRDLLTRLEDLIQRAQAIEVNLQLPPIHGFADIDTADAVAAVLKRSPGAPLAVLQNPAWNAPPPEARTVLERGRRVAALRKHIQDRFKRDVLSRNHSQDIAYLEEKSRGLFRLFAFLDQRYREIRDRWQGYRLASYTASLTEQAADMRKVDQLRAERKALEVDQPLARQLFGALWQGESSSWEALDGYVRWVVEFRALCVRHTLTGKAVEAAAKGSPDVSPVVDLKQRAASALAALAAFREAVGWPKGYLADAPLTDIRDRVHALLEGLRLGPRWASFTSAHEKAASGLAHELVAAAMHGAMAFGDLPRAFLRAFYQKWLATVVQEREPLRTFNTLTHEQRVLEFRDLDKRLLEHNQRALIARLRDFTQERLRMPHAVAAMVPLRSEMTRQRGLSPLRKTIRRAEAAMHAIKPCFLMSPLTVAQYLRGSEPSFDVVIFDEASQLPPEDAVGAILRGKQLVVVGDPKQLPPTNFFAVMAGQIEAVIGDNGEPLFEDRESILEEFMASGAAKSRLKWHYRSKHESLITFSNVQFYDAELRTFPSADRDSHRAGLRFEYIPDAVYEGHGLNPIEARRVAKAVIEHARRHPEVSLGVGTFNLRQQLAIQDQLEIYRREDPSVEDFFAKKDGESFFVKNLENIQGDERDVIFLSVTYAKGRDGKLRFQFGPLNAENGWRRLNVLVTRARQSMHVFSSIHAGDINVATTPSLGAKLLHDFLAYAEHGTLDSAILRAAAQTESPFEEEVFKELTRHGLTLDPQVGVAGYRIDLAVRDEAVPGQYVCGIECDGVAYHSSETARDRDRLREEALRDRGWIIHRIWSTDWFKDREGQIERILRLVEESRARPRRVEATPEVPPDPEPDHPSTDVAAPAGEDPPPPATYQTPTAQPYRLAGGEGRYRGHDILTAPSYQIDAAIHAVLEAEAPLHLTDLLTRIAGMWGKKAGSRIAGRISECLGRAVRVGDVVRRGDFVWAPSTQVTVRSRAGTGIPAERICPEEYREAVLTALRSGQGFARAQLTNEVRSFLGFNRTGAILEEQIGKAIDTLLREDVLGEGSAGIVLRM